ncbi:MAG: DUF4239 domain-containing protein [Planctomycetes bacterium]|jgi:hypothetical protein|nr:DUF4239 domain-containing protein [Planctomycetota bacterium]
MTAVTLGWLSAALLLAGLLAMLEVGHRIGKRVSAVDPEAVSGVGPIEGAVFALLGLMIAFTFSGAVGRFDERRALIVQEANAVGTAWLRLDLLVPDQQPALRDQLRAYVDARLDGYARLALDPHAEGVFAKADALAATMWKTAVAAVKTEGVPAAAMTLLMGSLNEMFDLAAVRVRAARSHPPPIIYGMLYLLALAAALFAGYGMGGCKRRAWLHSTGFAVVIAGTVGVTLDIEHPRQGLIRIDPFDQVLADVRAGMR